MVTALGSAVVEGSLNAMGSGHNFKSRKGQLIFIWMYNLPQSPLVPEIQLINLSKGTVTLSKKPSKNT